jgi:hypothetical protein
LITEYPVAIFHASFHPTKGNLVDWSLKASDGVLAIFISARDLVVLQTLSSMVLNLAPFPVVSTS